MNKEDLTNIIIIGNQMSKSQSKPLNKIYLVDVIKEYERQCREYYESLDCDYWAEQYSDEQYYADNWNG